MTTFAFSFVFILLLWSGQLVKVYEVYVDNFPSRAGAELNQLAKYYLPMFQEKEKEEEKRESISFYQDSEEII